MIYERDLQESYFCNHAYIHGVMMVETYSSKMLAEVAVGVECALGSQQNRCSQPVYPSHRMV